MNGWKHEGPIHPCTAEQIYGVAACLSGCGRSTGAGTRPLSQLNAGNRPVTGQQGWVLPGGKPQGGEAG